MLNAFDCHRLQRCAICACMNPSRTADCMSDGAPRPCGTTIDPLPDVAKSYSRVERARVESGGAPRGSHKTGPQRRARRLLARTIARLTRRDARGLECALP